MLDANLKAQLKTYLERVTRPIEIVVPRRWREVP